MMEQGMATSKAKASRSKLEVMHPDAAGIDVVGSMDFVAVPNEAAEQSVRQFGVYTRDLHAMADWLQACGVKIVAMESTGVYWIPLYVQAAGPVLRTAGVQPAQDEVAGRPGPQRVQHMQKAMTLMNIQLSQAISDVAGVTGQKIVGAIVEGERDATVLAAWRDSRIKASEEEIAASLQGTWRAEHLLALKQALGRFDFYAQQLQECETEVQRVMAKLEVHTKELSKGKKRSKAKNAPKFNVRERLLKMCGVDVTKMDGIDETTALNIVAEVGTDLSRFPSDKHFASWLGLCPGTRISGGKVLGAKTKHSVNRASQAFRQAAAALRSSKSALGAYYRRLCGRMDKGKAVTAAAHKLARLFYALMTKGQEYVDQGQQYYEERYRQRVIHHLQRRAQSLGMCLVPTA